MIWIWNCSWKCTKLKHSHFLEEYTTTQKLYLVSLELNSGLFIKFSHVHLHSHYSNNMEVIQWLFQYWCYLMGAKTQFYTLQTLMNFMLLTAFGFRSLLQSLEGVRNTTLLATKDNINTHTFLFYAPRNQCSDIWSGGGWVKQTQAQVHTSSQKTWRRSGISGN